MASLFEEDAIVSSRTGVRYRLPWANRTDIIVNSFTFRDRLPFCQSDNKMLPVWRE